MRAMMRLGAGAAALVLVGRGGLLLWGEGLLYVWWTGMSSMLGWRRCRQLYRPMGIGGGERSAAGSMIGSTDTNILWPILQMVSARAGSSVLSGAEDA